jgi:hypothetical protein
MSDTKTQFAPTDKTRSGRPRNPFRPGAGHMPPFLAGRKAEETSFRRLLEQEQILQNMILTGQARSYRCS